MSGTPMPMWSMNPVWGKEHLRCRGGAIVSDRCANVRMPECGSLLTATSTAMDAMPLGTTNDPRDRIRRSVGLECLDLWPNESSRCAS